MNLPLLFMLMTQTAHGGESACDPLAEAELVDRIHASLDAIFRQDVPGHQAIIEDLEARIPCLEFVPTPERWAELLVGIAIVEYATQGDWISPLNTALRIYPEVDLLVGGSHEIRSWRPPPAPPPSERRIPDGVRLYLDGEQIRVVPGVGGHHLAQLRTGDGWRSVLLNDEAIPEDWLDAGALGFSHSSNVRLDVGVGGGLLSANQTTDVPGSYLTDAADAGFGLKVIVRGSAGSTNGLGAYWDLGIPQAPSIHNFSAQGGGQLVLGPVEVYAGAGVLQSGATADEQFQGALLWFPSVGIGATTKTGPALDGRLLVGGTQALLQSSAIGGWTFGEGEMRVRIGVDSSWRRVLWEQVDVDRKLAVTTLEVGLNAGVRWGNR